MHKEGNKTLKHQNSVLKREITFEIWHLKKKMVTAKNL